ncbi:hypothetical protein CRT22_23575 [Escherichia sp. E5028]|uniref:hypothetical protein n=1 Tax=Escherichia sp. E5028 TaxID=2044602 RepID=UPI00107F9751|nr:hypothetical protein [Escherichia sp. E5028]TGB52800.1 hypothetical protein CRT22_23575 [Escherichia sp. E5028]
MFVKFFPLNIPAHGIKQNHKNIVYADSQNKNMDAMIITFANMMKAIGYTSSVHPAGGFLTTICENCWGVNSQRFEKKYHYYWACPDCQTITNGFFMASLWNQREENRLITSKGEEFWHSEGRRVYDRKYRQSYVVDDKGNLTQDGIPDYVLGRINIAQLEDAECRRLAWIEYAN